MDSASGRTPPADSQFRTGFVSSRRIRRQFEASDTTNHRVNRMAPERIAAPSGAKQEYASRFAKPVPRITNRTENTLGIHAGGCR
jgi:hypothetical protein